MPAPGQPPAAEQPQNTAAQLARSAPSSGLACSVAQLWPPCRGGLLQRKAGCCWRVASCPSDWSSWLLSVAFLAWCPVSAPVCGLWDAAGLDAEQGAQDAQEQAWMV
jgi:hypothetical protein